MKEKIIVFGNGDCSLDITEQLLGLNIDVVAAVDTDSAIFHRFEALSSDGSQNLELLPFTQCISCTGAAGQFELRLKIGNAVITRQAAGIVVAESETRSPNFSLYGIDPSDTVVSLTQLKDFFSSNLDPSRQFAEAGRTAFITGLAAESCPTIAEEVMSFARRLQLDFNQQTYILAGNLKVGGMGLEHLYRETKKAGTVYFKFTESMPVVTTEKNGRITFRFFDEAARESFKLSPDLTVIDETVHRAVLSEDLSKVFQLLDTGTGNFLQTDNLHRMTALTNRKGIFVAGASRWIPSKRNAYCDARSTVLSALKLIESGRKGGGEPGKAVIDSGQCVRCLTCYRICPYHAVLLNSKPVVVPQACEGCGICTTECPRGAVTLDTSDTQSISERIPSFNQTGKSSGFSPVIIAFCCSRSASSAAELAKCLGYSLPASIRIIDVPCGGSVSSEHLFTAFHQGADGVLVMTCHEGNCHSEKGNRYARHQAERLADSMERSGFDNGRIGCRTLASNMGVEFIEMVDAFEKRISELGPSPLR